MPPKTRKRKTSPNGQNGARAAAAAKKAALNSGKDNRAGRTADRATVDDQDEDEYERMDNNILFAIANTSSKRRVTANEARRGIRKAVDDLVLFMNDEKMKLVTPEKNSPSRSLDGLRADVAFDSALSKGESTTRLDGQAFLAKVRKSIDSLRSNVRDYETLTRHDTGVEKPTWMRWQADQKDLRKLNNYAQKLAREVVDNAIMPATHDHHHRVLANGGPSDRASEIEILAWDLLQYRRRKPVEITWGGAARSQMRVLAGLQELIGEDERKNIRG